ncbi:MAG: DUF2007 domain-containing protein, partial [Spirochaetes bacterium]|nr:DUF2007 domain-containing protein [Spirochaetota bacterium]
GGNMKLKKKKKDDLIIFHSGEIVEVQIITKELERNNIKVYPVDENASVLFPANISPGGIAPFRIMIRRKDLEKAKKVVEKFLKKKKN